MHTKYNYITNSLHGLLVLLGGLDNTGSPLIIFPPSNEFVNINDTDVEKIFHYLIQRFG